MRKTLQKLDSSTKNGIYREKKVWKARERMTRAAILAAQQALTKLVCAVNAGEVEFLTSRSLSVMEYTGLALLKIGKCHLAK